MSPDQSEQFTTKHHERPRPKRWSLVVCLLLAAGFVVARDVGPLVYWAWWLAAAIGLLFVASLSRGRVCIAALGLATVFFGAGWFHLRVLEPLSTLPSVSDEPRVVRLVGVLSDAPEPTPPGQGALAEFVPVEPRLGFTMVLTGERDGATPTGGTVRVRVPGIQSDAPEWLKPGACAEIIGRFRAEEGAENPGQLDRRMLAASRGEWGSVDVPDLELIARRDADTFASKWRSALYASLGVMHARAKRVIAPQQGTHDPAARALLGALLLGERDPALRDVSAAFGRLGLLHLVAISGFNLVVMGAVVLFLLRLTGDRGIIELLVLGALIVGYMLLLPAQAAILRAGVLMLAVIAAEILGRRHDRATILGWVGAGLLLASPMDLWSMGFQLSMGIACVLLLLGDHVTDRIFGVPLKGLVGTHARAGKPRWSDSLPMVGRWLTGALRGNVSASVLAWSVSFPIIAFHTGLISPLAIVTTIVVLPMTVIVLWVGYVALLVGMAIPSAGGAIASFMLDGLGSCLVNVVMLLDRVPGTSVRVPALSVWWAIAAVLAAVYIIRFGHRRDTIAWALGLIVVLWMTIECTLGPRSTSRGPLRIDTLSVGQGSCHLVRTRENAVLYACGSRSSGIGVREVPEAVRALGAWAVPTIVIPAPGFDVLSGVLDVVEPLGLKRVVIGTSVQEMANSPARTAAGTVLRALRERGVEIVVARDGDTLDLGSAEMQFMSVGEDGAGGSLAATVRAKTRTGDRFVMFTSGLSRDEVGRLAERPGLPSKLIALELPSHGTPTPSGKKLAERTTPTVAIASDAGAKNAEDRWSTLSLGTLVISTGERGCISIVVGDDGEVRWSSSRK